MWYKNKVEASPGETVYEIIGAEDGLSFGMAVADIEQSEAHYHDDTTEIYSVLEGRVELTVDGCGYVLEENESITIDPRSVHSAKSMTGRRARVSVISKPPWSPDDHHLVK